MPSNWTVALLDCVHFKLSGGLPGATWNSSARMSQRPVLFSSPDCGQGWVQHDGTGQCNTWPCGPCVTSLLVQWRPLWVCLLQTGWFTRWQLPLVSQYALRQIGFWVSAHHHFAHTLRKQLLSIIKVWKIATRQRKPARGRRFNPESPTTAEARWKCDRSTLKEVIEMVLGLI